MTQVPLFLTPRQAADHLCEAGLPVTEDTVRRWAREGMVPAMKMPGGQYRLKREHVDAILAGDNIPVRAA